MNKLQQEADRQLILLRTIEEQGFVPVDKDHPLINMVGTVQRFKVRIDCITPKLLCKLHIEGSDESSYHFISLLQIIKSQGIDIIHTQGVYPQPGAEFELTCVVGPRRILDERSWVPALRLPRN